MAVTLSVFPSSWGWVGIAISEKGLAGITLPRPTEEASWSLLRTEHPGATRSQGDEWAEVRQRLLDYLEGKCADFSNIPLDLPDGPPFHRKVWEACARIPYGETRSYAQLAAEAGSPRAFRAVGSAMASNPIPIIVPCHRVVGSNGSLVGFGGGLPQKKRMLEMESQARREEP
jgi:O-6-methylguanine DNA methyltransferase